MIYVINSAAFRKPASPECFHDRRWYRRSPLRCRKLDITFGSSSSTSFTSIGFIPTASIIPCLLLDSRALVSGPPSCFIHYAVINWNLGNKFSLFKISETPVSLFSSIPMHRLSSYIEHLQFFADAWLPSTLWAAAHMAPSTWSSLCLLCSLSPHGLSRDIIFSRNFPLVPRPDYISLLGYHPSIPELPLPGPSETCIVKWLCNCISF